MDLDGGQIDDDSIISHQYPDPDYASYATKYPWGGEDDGYVLSALRDKNHESWEEREGEPSKSHFQGGEIISTYSKYDLPQGSNNDMAFDPEYQVSESGATNDENISDPDSDSSTSDLRRDFEGRKLPFFDQQSVHGQNAGARSSSTRGKRGRPRGLGRGGRGIKRGIRNPIEPTPEFKALHSQATMAFIDHDYEQAEYFTLQALTLNPEMYPAHSLLSEIHLARGEKEKAILAAWNGAHTKPRDTQMWSRIARLILERDGQDRESTLRDAIYCYTRIISVESTNVEARFQRAALNQELGYKGKVASEYEQLLKQLPHDTSVLRHLAEIYIETDDAQRALTHYETSIGYLQKTEPDDPASFTWSDVNIVGELYGFQQRYDDGISKLKSLSRWLLGRRNELFWETFENDDREWDGEDEPRRVEVPHYRPGAFDIVSYGSGLPLEIRIRLGIFRLRSKQRNPGEAMNHFAWLEPENHEAGAKLFDYPDLFREAANALRGNNQYQEALQYYEPLQYVSDYMDASYLFEMAACYRSLGLKDETEDCYNTIIDNDEKCIEARLKLVEVRREFGLSRDDGGKSHTAVSVFKAKSRRPERVRGPRQATDANTDPNYSTYTMLAPRPVAPSAKQISLEKEQEEEEVIYMRFQHREEMMARMKQGEGNLRIEWKATSKSLIQRFRDNKVFYPYDKHHKFYGYSKEARSLASRKKYEVDALAAEPQSHLVTEEGDEATIPDKYCGIHFHVWLDVFLEYAMALTTDGDTESAYQIIASAYHANVFHHSPEALFAVHVCWFTCALLANDDETLCSIARWFMRDYQFFTDGYRLYSILNRLCDSENSCYNSGPSQKFILRQLKAVDFSFMGDVRRRTTFQERASYSTRDSKGNPIEAQTMDVALLMLYGHILFAGKSYAYAVNYFLRALSLDPCNSMIKLSLSLSYIQYALKRQADNRHRLLMQGLAFLVDYYDDRLELGNCSEKQEAEYNVARAYHLLGLTHLAIPYYERCLDLSSLVQAHYEGCDVEDFAPEAALSLQGIWAASNNTEQARQITETWLVI